MPIAVRQGVKIAIQVKGYHNSVGNSAVQEAFAGKSHYKCQHCAVITNSRFTSGTVELARSTGCILVHEDNFREFVMGRWGTSAFAARDSDLTRRLSGYAAQQSGEA